jgi:hypothetical protein
LKNSNTYPNTPLTYSENATFSKINRTIAQFPTGVPNKINMVDSTQYGNYVSGSPITTDFIPLNVNTLEGGSGNSGNTSSVIQQQISQLQDEIQVLGSQIETNTFDLQKKNLTSSQQIRVNNIDIKKNKQQTTQTNNSLNVEVVYDNTEGIVNDTNQLVLMRDYQYIIWGGVFLFLFIMLSWTMSGGISMSFGFLIFLLIATLFFFYYGVSVPPFSTFISSSTFSFVSSSFQGAFQLVRQYTLLLIIVAIPLMIFIYSRIRSNSSSSSNKNSLFRSNPFNKNSLFRSNSSNKNSFFTSNPSNSKNTTNSISSYLPKVFSTQYNRNVLTKPSFFPR